MPDISSDKIMASCYPPQSLYDDWNDHADRLDLAVSQFIIRMVETGRKQIDIQSDTDDSARRLRRQLADVQRELDRQRTRNQELERQLRHTAHAEIVSYVQENPGVGTAEIIQHVADTVPGRVAGHIDVLEGNEIQQSEDGYYPVNN